MPGYGDAAAIRERFASGHTIKLNQPEHWHPGIKELVTGLRTEFRAEVRSSVFVRPPGGSRMRAHAHEAHVFVLQLDGQMDWCAGESPGRDPSGQQAVQATLLPGDVLYLPSGHPHCPNPHYAAGHGPDSLYLTIAIRPPSARNLAELALARFMTGPRVEEGCIFVTVVKLL
jgi:ribosomal protein L16 Arg81 hydroxylase